MVTPGIRQAGDAVGDQRRVVTPSDAIAAGATHIVVGRSITASHSPAETVLDILASMSRLWRVSPLILISSAS